VYTGWQCIQDVQDVQDVRDVRDNYKKGGFPPKDCSDDVVTPLKLWWWWRNHVSPHRNTLDHEPCLANVKHKVHLFTRSRGVKGKHVEFPVGPLTLNPLVRQEILDVHLSKTRGVFKVSLHVLVVV
jgi:hypothetical protein